MKRYFWPIFSAVLGAITSSALLVLLLAYMAWLSTPNLPAGMLVTLVSVTFIEVNGQTLGLEEVVKYAASFGSVIGFITWAVFRPRKIN